MTLLALNTFTSYFLTDFTQASRSRHGRRRGKVSSESIPGATRTGLNPRSPVASPTRVGHGLDSFHPQIGSDWIRSDDYDPVL